MNKKSIKDVISRFSFLVPRSSLGFASILPLLIIALAAISSSTPLLVENLLNGNPPGQKIASNDAQQIQQTPNCETLTTPSTCNNDSNCYWNLTGTGARLCSTIPKGSPAGAGIWCAPGLRYVPSLDRCLLDSCSDYKQSATCNNDSNCYWNLTGTGARLCSTIPKGSPAGAGIWCAPGLRYVPSLDRCLLDSCSDYKQSATCNNDSNCYWYPGNDAGGTSRGCADKATQGEKCGAGYCSDNFPKCVNDTFCSVGGPNDNSPQQPAQNQAKDLTIIFSPNTNITSAKNSSSQKIADANAVIESFDADINVSIQTSVGTKTIQKSKKPITLSDNKIIISKSEIENTLDCAGKTIDDCISSDGKASISFSLSNFKGKGIDPGGNSINISYNAGGSTGTLECKTNSCTGIKSVDLNSADVLSSGTISVSLSVKYSTDIISEKCGGKGVSDNSISGFLYTACMASSPTTLTEAEKGKFDQNKAALAKDKGNPYCGTNAFDVYQCKDGSIETIAIGESEDTCNTFPWCPEKGKTGLAPDPCAGPDNRPETCSCQPDSTSVSKGQFTQDNCAKDLFCAPGKNPQVPGYACCPKYEEFCPATNTCIGTNESCGSGVKAPDPLPTNQQSLGCPNQNPDGTQNVCSTISSTSSQPTDGIQSGNPGYDDTKSYTRNQNGDNACADNYASTSQTNFKYCWKESGSSSSQPGSGGGTGGQQPGSGGSGGGAGFIGKACPANSDASINSYVATACQNSTSGGNNIYCTRDFKDATWACCQFGTRFCSLNNLCVSSQNDCIAPTQNPSSNSGNGNTTQPGTAGGPGSATNHCYNGQKDCTPGYLCSNPAGGGTAQCVVRGPEDPESNCAIADGLECTDTYDASLNVDDALARDVCRSEGKKYCAKKLQPAQSGCPGGKDYTFPDGTSGKSVCQASSTCPAGTKSGSAANNLACGNGEFCCIDTRYTGSTASTGNSQSVTSIPENLCKTSRDCVNSKSGNACVYFTSSSTGICKTY